MYLALSLAAAVLGSAVLEAGWAKLPKTTATVTDMFYAAAFGCFLVRMWVLINRMEE